MKKDYIAPDVRIVMYLPDDIYTVSAVDGSLDEDDDATVDMVG